MPETLEEVVEARASAVSMRNEVRAVINHDLTSILRDFKLNPTYINASDVPTVHRLTAMYLADRDLVTEVAKLDLMIARKAGY